MKFNFFDLCKNMLQVAEICIVTNVWFKKNEDFCWTLQWLELHEELCTADQDLICKMSIA